jgi:DNA-binding IclR family transcriptional regulator
MKTCREKKGTKSVVTALSLLDLFTQERQQIGLSDLSGLAGIPKANILRHLNALEYGGLVRQDPRTKKYQLGFKSLALAYLVNKQFSLRDMALPYMERLRERTSETVCLQVEENGRGICIERLEANNKLVYMPPIGSREYLHAGASRKVLLAFLPDERIEEIIAAGLPAVTAKTVTDPEQLRQEITRIRVSGYAITESEHVEGVTAISFPIRERDGRTVASLSVVGPTFRMSEEKKGQYLENLKETAREISLELGLKG